MIDLEKPQFRTIKYHQHGILTKKFNFKTDEEFWSFETSGLSRDYEGEGITAILDDLSINGFELVAGYDDEYILRTKNEIEDIQEYYTDEDEADKGTVEEENKECILMNKDELPEILTAKLIAAYLGLSLRRVYELFQTFPSAGGIPILR